MKKPLGHRIWFKILLTILVFIPSIAENAYDPADSTNVIAEVLAHPLAAMVPALLPAAKILLLAAVLIAFLNRKSAGRFFMTYYAFILLVVGFLQNMAYTESYGFVWLMGNTLVQLAVAAYCIYDAVKEKTFFTVQDINRKRLWVLIPMLLAFLMPYSVSTDGLVQPAFSLNILLNEAGVTYCMITPVLLGVMIIFSKGMHKPLMSVAAYVGLIFGLLNMMTWFGMQSQNWWMGVLHLPLLILSFYALVLSRMSRKADVPQAPGIL